VTEVPTPIPAEGVWSGDPADLPNWDAMPRRNRRRRRRSHYPIWLKYLGWVLGLAVLVTAAQIAYHAIRSDPRDATQFATRQLRSSALRPDEKIRASVDVWQRPPIDYFRATRGILVLTDAPGDSAKPIGGRLIYLGLQPRDPLSPPDAPPTFDERDWPVDTLVEVEPTRTFFLISKALRITAPREGRLTLGLASGSSPSADSLRTQLERKYAAIRAVGWQRREERRAADRAKVVAMQEGMRAWYHTIRRGEALASIARMFNTTPEALRALNGIQGDRVRIGQTIMVKPFTRKPMPTPPGAVPERAPTAAAPPTAAPAATPAPPRR
jgi:LysM repeat protein